MFYRLYHRANLHSSPITRFAMELQLFVCDHATPAITEKLRSKGIAMHMYGISVYYVYNKSQLNGTLMELLEMNVNIM